MIYMEDVHHSLSNVATLEIGANHRYGEMDGKTEVMVSLKGCA